MDILVPANQLLPILEEQLKDNMKKMMENEKIRVEVTKMAWEKGGIRVWVTQKKK